jgi:hypothetical protein
MLPYAVLAVLVAINVSLIAVLLREPEYFTAEPAADVPVTLAPSTSSPSNTVPTPTASDSPNPTETPTPTTKSERLDAVQTNRHMIAISPREAWRATVGDCNKPGQLERSTDAGRTWTDAAKIDLAPITRLGLEAGNVYAVGGGGKSCSPRYVAYSSNGVVVAQTASPKNLWFIDPSNRDQVYGPPGIKSKPCRRQHVVGLATIDAFKALLVCTDGTAMMTTDSGKSWAKADELPETTAVGSGGGHFWVARKIPSCHGVSVQRLKVNGDELSRGARRCARGVEIAPGRMALDVSGTAIWLWVGDEVRISTDGGRSWSQ